MPDSSPPAPDQETLHQAALSYLARYAATRAALRRVLARRVERWARSQDDADQAALAAAQAAVDTVVERMVRAGAVSDEAFAEAKARSLTRAGKSARSIQSRLIAKGVGPTVARDAVANDADTELAAALILTRRRRIGPYRVSANPDPAARAKEIGILARAGFSRDVVQQALSMPLEEAERRIYELRR